MLNKKEHLDPQKIDFILKEIDKLGYNQLILTGGEPMVRLNWVEQIVGDWSNKVNCWMFTSGFDLSLENSRRLKSAGLKGVFISLDHHDKVLHNTFRGLCKTNLFINFMRQTHILILHRRINP